MNAKPTYRITLEALPGSSPAINRLRMALKSLVRAFGLRCLACEDITPAIQPVACCDDGDAAKKAQGALVGISTAMEIADK